MALAKIIHFLAKAIVIIPTLYFQLKLETIQIFENRMHWIVTITELAWKI